MTLNDFECRERPFYVKFSLLRLKFALKVELQRRSLISVRSVFQACDPSTCPRHDNSPFTEAHIEHRTCQ